MIRVRVKVRDKLIFNVPFPGISLETLTASSDAPTLQVTMAHTFIITYGDFKSRPLVRLFTLLET